VINNNLTGDDINESTLGTVPLAANGVRAYGRVSSSGILSRSRNVSGVTRPFAGTFCIALAADIDVSQTGLVATPDFADDATSFSTNGPQAIVEWDSAGAGCSSGQLKVATGYRSPSTAGSPDGDVRSVANIRQNEPFFFVVP
jgi:hypothetical protein